MPQFGERQVYTPHKTWSGGLRVAVFISGKQTHLSIIRTEGDWEAWVAFFLEGVVKAANDTERSIIAIASLIAADRRRLLEAPKVGRASCRLFELLPMMPRFTIERVRQKLETTFSTAIAAVKVLEDLGIVTEMTGQKKNRRYSYQPYIELLSRWLRSNWRQFAVVRNG
jgi:Fic family protein